MAYDEKLGDRVRAQLTGRPGYSERKMFGGLCFMLDGNMCCGVLADRLVIRAGPEEYAELLKRKNTKPFDFTGKALRGFVVVMPEGMKTKRALDGWIARAVDFAGNLPAKEKKTKTKTK
ncbi:MAG: TfoX/Sxy family protein, partial [Rhodospirillales bacterium]|nr:TfoX/Sxy family protein [Rhodospirillales bacterium]